MTEWCVWRSSLLGGNDVRVLDYRMPGILTALCTKGTQWNTVQEHWALLQNVTHSTICICNYPRKLSSGVRFNLLMFVCVHFILTHTGVMFSMFEYLSWAWGLDSYNGCLPEATCSEVRWPLTSPAVALLFSEKLFHGAWTSFILSSVNPVSLSPHIVSSWAALHCVSLFFLSTSVSVHNVAMVM